MSERKRKMQKGEPVEDRHMLWAILKCGEHISLCGAKTPQKLIVRGEKNWKFVTCLKCLERSRMAL